MIGGAIVGRTTDIITKHNAHKVSPGNRLDCLNCPLAECVDTPHALPTSARCPIDGHYGEWAHIVKRRAREAEQLQAIERALKDGAASLGQLAKLSGVSRLRVTKYVRRGQLVVEGAGDGRTKVPVEVVWDNL